MVGTSTLQLTLWTVQLTVWTNRDPQPPSTKGLHDLSKCNKTGHGGGLPRYIVVSVLAFLLRRSKLRRIQNLAVLGKATLVLHT